MLGLKLNHVNKRGPCPYCYLNHSYCICQGVILYIVAAYIIPIVYVGVVMSLLVTGVIIMWGALAVLNGSSKVHQFEVSPHEYKTWCGRWSTYMQPWDEWSTV